MHPYDVLTLDNGSKLIFTPCPGTKGEDVQKSVKTLKKAGAAAIITMMPGREMAKLEVENIPSATEENGLSWFHLPVEDDEAPEAAFQRGWVEQKDDILALLNDHSTVAIHCKGGSSRTGLMASVLMLELGMGWHKVEKQVQGIRPKALTLAPHRAFLHSQYSVQI